MKLLLDILSKNKFYLSIKASYLSFYWKDEFDSNFQSSERVTHFINKESNLYADKEKGAKPSAFNINKGRGDCSVYRIKKINPSIIWKIATHFFDIFSDKKTVARANFDLSCLSGYRSITFNPDGRPYKRHLNIENIPTSEKSLLRDIKLELSKNSNVDRKKES